MYNKYIPVGGSSLLAVLVRSTSYQRQSCCRIAPIPMCMQGIVGGLKMYCYCLCPLWGRVEEI